MATEEFFIPVISGADTYVPGVSGRNPGFIRLKNIDTRRRFLRSPGALIAVDGDPLASIGDIKSFAVAYDVSNIVAYLYSFGEVNYGFYQGGNWLPSPTVPTGYTNSTMPVAGIGWENDLYATRYDFPITRINSGASTTIDSSYSLGSGNLSGRYIVISNGHLMIANVKEVSAQAQPIRVQWSDLYRPTEWQIAESNEADFFDLDADNFEITGLTVQKGRTLIFTVNSIWQAIYVGFDQGIYRFDVAYTEVGNFFNYSHIQVRGIDFFIGSDNIYALEGSQLSPIGDPIWNFFKETISNFEQGAEVIASVNRRNNEVFWTYENAQEGNEEWHIVYNYRENQWSDRSAQDSNVWFTIDGDISVYDEVIDDVSTIIDNDNTIIDDSSPISIFPQSAIVGGDGGIIYNYDESQRPLEGQITTWEFTLDSAYSEKEFKEARLLIRQEGTPAVTVEVGQRNSQSEDIVWSSPSSIQTGGDFDGEALVIIQNALKAKYFSFRITWTNSTDNFVDEYLGISILMSNKSFNVNR